MLIPYGVELEAQTQPVANLKDIVDVVGSGVHFAIDKNGTLRSWEHNSPAAIPTVVGGIDQVVAFSGNYAVTKTGSVFFWGSYLSQMSNPCLSGTIRDFDTPSYPCQEDGQIVLTPRMIPDVSLR